MIQPVSPAPAAEAADVVRAAHHQIGNSLQSIASLLRMESQLAPPAAAAVLTEAGRRVRTVMRLHQRLQESGVAVRLDDLLGDVCRDVAELDAFDRHADIRVNVAPLWASAKVASALAMITAEWLGNALEHGLSDGPGAVEVTLESTDAGARLIVADSGRGVADGEWTSGFGLNLVASLAKQLGARVHRTADGRGASWELLLGESSLGRFAP
ncbi:sensor histidine kinase [Brevundimonas sp.]|uniref:sensor histidine kinase n=1 Tax=Brevundimonas sp. TaxID=1871086 RepID=UPI0035B41F38